VAEGTNSSAIPSFAIVSNNQGFQIIIDNARYLWIKLCAKQSRRQVGTYAIIIASGEQLC
jgi:hypothetical protein